VAEGMPSNGMPADTTHPPPAASSFDAEAGQFLRRFVDPDAYDAHVQNWDATQDSSGVLYVGNGNGVLAYDGHRWQTIPVSNRSAVRSLATDAQSRVFVGGKQEFGKMQRDSLGRLEYRSLTDPVPSEHQSFSYVWNTTIASDGAYFQASNYLFRWTPETETLQSWGFENSRIRSASAVRGTLFFGIEGRGLMTVQGDSPQPVPGGAFFEDKTVAFVLPHGDDGLLVGTKNQLFVRDGSEFRPFDTTADSLLRRSWVYTATVLPDQTIAIGTIDRGLILLSPDGTLHRHLAARDKPVTTLYYDQEGGLWAVLDGGLLRYDLSAPFTEYGPENGLEGLVTNVATHRGGLHVATTQSIYRQHVPGDTLASFKPLPEGAESTGGGWSLLSVGDTLLAGLRRGMYQIGPDGSVRRRFQSNMGIVRDLHRSRIDSSRIYAATRRGVWRLSRTEQGWTPTLRIPGLEAEVTNLAEENGGTLWAGTNYRGIYRIQGAGANDSTVVDHFGTEHGLPRGIVDPVRWRGEVVFDTEVAPMRFVPSPNPHFERITSIELPDQKQTPGESVGVSSDNQDRTWGLAWGLPGRWIERDSTWHWAPGPLRRIHHRDVLSVYATESGEGALWMSTDDERFIRYVPDTGASPPPPPIQIRRVTTTGTDSLLTAGGASASPPDLPYTDNGVQVSFATPSLIQPSVVEYQYQLRGRDSEWSDWTPRTEQAFRPLEPGTFTFAVRARTAYGDTTNTARYTFTVLPPWYRTWWAYGLYLLAAVGVLAGAVRWRTWQLRRRQEKLAATVETRTREIEQQKEQLAEQAERLQELDDAKSRFFANISHEFRTPITLIQGPAREVRERLQEGTIDPDTDVEQLSLIERNAGRLLRLVDQILGIARLEAGTYELDARPTDVQAEIQRIGRTFEPLAEREELTLTVEADAPSPDAPPIYVDREALEHVMSNLLSNAIKFTPPGGRITVTVTETEEAVAVAVSDTGPGIPDAEQSAIFDRFRQVDDAPTREQEGAGIGLAFAADLIDLHGGSIDVESAEGEGATFTVRLPRGANHLAEDQLAPESPSDQAVPPPEASEAASAPEPDGPPASVPSSTESPSPEEERTPSVPNESHDPQSTQAPATDGAARKKLVLVVDDNAEVRRYVRSILEPDFAVIEAADGEDGVAVAREELPDVILADVMMPDVDGHEMTKRLKEDPETEAIPVVMVTARAGTDEEVEGLQVGADDYVTKPFDADVLHQRVGGVITLQERLRDHLREELSADEVEPSEAPDSTDDQSDVEREARTIIREHLPDPDFEVNDLAEKMAMSRSALYRTFNEHTDQTPSELITEMRMEKAVELLRDGKGTITQVAYAVGYERHSSFSRAFREHTGQAPSTLTAER